MFSRNQLLIVLSIVNALLVLFVVPLISQWFPGMYHIDNFPDGYDLLAENLLAGNGYRFYPESSETLLRTPGFVFLLATLFSIFGKSLVTVKIFNVVLTILAGWMAVHITRTYIDKSISFLPAAIIFLHPGIILAESRGGVESLFTFLLTALVLLIFKAIDSNSYRLFACVGLVLGCALTVKSTPLLVPAVIFFFYMASSHWSFREMGHVVGKVTLVSLVALFVLSPWVVRNYNLTGKIIPTAMVKGVAAYQGFYLNKTMSSEKNVVQRLIDVSQEQNQLAIDMGLKLHKEGSFFQYFYTVKDEVTFYNHIFNAVVDEYKKSPGLLVKYTAINFFRFWFQGRTDKATLLNIIVTLPLLILVVYGSVYAFRRQLNITIILLFVVFYIAPHLPTIALARYYIPLIPQLAIVASIAALPLRDLYKSQQLKSNRAS